MPVLETGKKLFEKATGWSRPAKRDLAALVRERNPQQHRFKDDGTIPNHPHWPLILYRGAVRLSENFDPAAILEELFTKNKWEGSWRDGIYDYAHYHSRTHEVLGIAAGRGRVQFGGPKGRIFFLRAGDIAILPAGTGHQSLGASDDFLVVGAYPPEGRYDECTSTREYAKAIKSIRKVRKPPADPVYGRMGPLKELWKHRP
jgi:uncharacterized protein YjlB